MRLNLPPDHCVFPLRGQLRNDLLICLIGYNNVGIESGFLFFAAAIVAIDAYFGSLGVDGSMGRVLKAARIGLGLTYWLTLAGAILSPKI